MTGKLLVLTGFPAAGKDSVISKFLKRNPDFRLIVSHTSRPIRKGEIHGVHQHFVTKREFEKLIAGKHFLEHVRTGLYYKGTSYEEFNQVLKGTNTIWRVELTRFISFEETIRTNFKIDVAESIISKSVKILIKPESKKVAIERYFGRDKKSDPKDFHKRWDFEIGHFKKHRDKIPHVVTNRTGKITDAAYEIERLLSENLL